MEAATPTKRILALDVMRGIAIVGMILFNTSSGNHFAPLKHAHWIGLNPADLAFPFFMFIMGITTYISLKKYDFRPTAQTFRKILTRMFGIILICIAFDWLHDSLFYWDKVHEGLALGTQILQSVTQWNDLRLSGVLVRLGLCYGLCAIIAVTCNHKKIPWLIVILLVVYTIILLLGNGFVQDETNIEGIVDRAVLGHDHMYRDHGIDPEGLLSTLPSLAHVLIGFWVGERIFKTSETSKDALNAKIQYLFIFGSILVFLGYLLSYGCPISKKMWTPTFVFVTCGSGAMLLALLIYFIDCKGHNGAWTTFFKSFGANPLVLYLLSEALCWVFDFIELNWFGKKMDIWKVIYSRMLQPVFGDYLGDLVFALFIVFLCWIVGHTLYRKRIFIKL